MRTALMTGVLGVCAAAWAAVEPGDRLTPLGTFKDWPAVEPREFVLSPDGLHVYPTITGFPSSPWDGATVLARDPATGSLSTALTFDRGDLGLPSSSVAISPTGSHVYHATASGVIAAYARDAGTGDLTFVELEPAQLGVGDAMVVSPDGAHLYSVDFASLSAYERDGVSGALTYLTTYQDGLAGFDGLSLPRDVAISPDGAHLYVAAEGDDAIGVFERNAGTGLLTFVETQVDGVAGVDGLDRATGVAVSPDGAHVYALGAPDGLAVFERDAGTGALTFLEVHKDGVNGVDGLFGSPAAARPTITVAPDGLHVYASVSGAAPTFDNALTVFRRDPGTGLLTFVEAHFADETFDDSALTATRRVRVSPDGAHVYVASDAVTSFGFFRPLTVACPALPSGACREAVAPGGGRITLKDKGVPGSEKALFKWLKGAAIDVAELGDPVGGDTDYALCIYDGSAAEQPLLEAAMPAAGECRGRPCWTASGGAVKYKNGDRLRQPDGIVTAKLLTGADGRAKVIVRGKREPLPLPALPLTTPVVAQVHGANGLCFTATFSTPTRNDATSFTAKAD